MTITHNVAASRFECLIGGELAVCEYRRSGKTWELHHTYVPEGMRGRGLAAALVEAALLHVQAQGGTVIPSCSYVATYIDRNLKFQPLVAGRSD